MWIVKLLSAMFAAAFGWMWRSRKYRTIDKLLGTPEGTRRLAAALAGIRVADCRSRDTSGRVPAGVFRHAVVVDRLPDRKPLRASGCGYSKDPDGRLVAPVEHGARMDFYAPLLDRPGDDIDTLGFSMLDKATTMVDSATGELFNARITVDGHLDRASLKAACAEINKHGRPVARLFMNPCEYFDIRYRTSGCDASTRRRFEEGHLATIWGADIIVSENVPEGTVYVCADREYVGVMPERQGTAVGIAIHNPKGVATITVRRCVAPPVKSVFHHAVTIDPLPDGKRAYYSRLQDTPAIVIGEDGRTPTTVFVGKKIFVPLFDLTDRVRGARDALGFSTFDAALATVDPNTDDLFNDPIKVAGSLNFTSLADAYAEVEKHDLHVARVFMNPREYSDIQSDPAIQRLPLTNHVKATLWNAKVIVSENVPEGTVYVCADRKYVGVMPKGQGGSVGICIHNPRGIASVTVRR